MKRVYFEAHSNKSSYSDVVTSYVDASNPNSLDLLSNIIEVNEEQLENDNEEYKNGNDKDDNAENDEDGYRSENIESESSSSAPADEHFDSQVNLVVAKNSPRESFKVFNQ